ncbi:MAG: LytTR family transcriptional regulator DNA-binding domain-containing protein, partial [Waltera sp.]
ALKCCIYADNRIFYIKFLVNLKHIKSITGYSVILNNNQKLVVPRARYKDVKSAFIAYKGEV